ncbi:MAG: ABC transporter permease [Alphaproteobacteria bacterium]
MNLAEQFTVAFQLLSNFDNNIYSIIGLSLYISISATILASIFSLPLGVLIGITNFPFRNTVISILNGLMGMPPVVLGLIGYITFSRVGPLGHLGILYTPTSMIIVQSILILPIITAHIRAISQIQYEKSYMYYNMINASKYQTITSLIFEIRFVIFTAIMAGLGRALSEVGAMLIVGGNINGYTRIMTTSIALETGKGNLGFALALGIVLLAIIMLLNHITTMINHYRQVKYNDKV